MGKDYLLDSTSFVLLVIYAFIAMTRTNDSFLLLLMGYFRMFMHLLWKLF